MSTPQNSSSPNSSSPNTVYTKFEVPSLKDLEMFDHFLNSNNHMQPQLSTPSGMTNPHPNYYEPNSQTHCPYVPNFYLNYNANSSPNQFPWVAASYPDFQPQPPCENPQEFYLPMPTVFEPTLALPQPPRIYTNPVNHSQQNHQEYFNRPMPVTRPEGKQGILVLIIIIIH